MIHSRKVTATLLVACTALACTESEVTDTEDRTFIFECSEGGCRLSLKKSPQASSPHAAAAGSQAAPRFVAQSDTRVLTVCPQKGSPFDCRPLTCTKGAVCSQLGGPGFTCEHGICQAPDRELAFPDRLALCFAGTGIWQRSVEQVQRLTLARACKPPCTVPAACRKP